MTRRPLLMVGNFLSSTHGVRGVCEELAARLPPIGWPVLTTSRQPARVARLYDMLDTAWRRRGSYSIAQVDVYSGAAFSWAEAVCWMLRRAGKPYVLTLHGGNLPSFAGRWPRRVETLLRSAAEVTAPSRYLLERMRPYREKITLQPNPLDVERYEFRPRVKPRPRLIWLRAFHHMYNPALAPLVLAKLLPEFPDMTLMMFGPDKGDGSLRLVRETAGRLRVADRVTFAGRIPKTQIAAHLNRGDIFLNTTDIDNTPVSVLEAMACGLCVVSTDVGGLPYLISHEQDGLLVPRADAEAMARAVQRILTETSLAADLSRHARLKAEGCDWKNVLPQWDNLLTSVMAQCERGAAKTPPLRQVAGC